MEYYEGLYVNGSSLKWKCIGCAVIDSPVMNGRRRRTLLSDKSCKPSVPNDTAKRGRGGTIHQGSGAHRRPRGDRTLAVRRPHVTVSQIVDGEAVKRHIRAATSLKEDQTG
ncbi:hypothetical protein EYF80_011781 [Liparis tanakae]|uniref:Uncharacterized protein n=1 Tax=Liparis tanakae TaxID=230148 RepID=A0A4Z2IJQ7_9TELE|nr:hypothetical protein EYF80_011781 [Liparis tanakae]